MAAVGHREFSKFVVYATCL